MRESPPAERIGDLAIVLHSHMPYVEGFGTYPFGEEWLFDAVIRSYVPVLEAARDLTITITPVLADQLEAPGVADRLLSFGRELRLRSAERDLADVAEEHRPAAQAEAERYGEGVARLERTGGDLLELFRAASRDRHLSLIPSTATHAVLPMLATTASARLQIDAGLRSHRRRFGAARGFWLPECAFRPGIEPLLAERGLRWFCTDQSPHEDEDSALTPVRAGAGTTAFTIDWPTVERIWSRDGYPSAPAYADFHRLSMRGMRLFAIDGGPYDPGAGSELVEHQAADFADAVADRLRRFAGRHGRPGLLTVAIDTELLGHWWSEGATWLARALREIPRRGVRLLTLDDALEVHEGSERRLFSSSWGEGKDLRTWDRREVADLAWGARRLELRLLREASRGRLGSARLERAARELLAVQSSDWAFLDGRRQAGDYPFLRTLGHSERFFEAIDSGPSPDRQLRNLAPDMSLAPLLEP